MRKSVHSYISNKCVCTKIFGISVTCSVCKLGSTTKVSSHEGVKPKAEMTPQTRVASEPSYQKRPELKAQLTKVSRTASLQGYNDAFSDYIARAKLRIRAMSNVGCEKIASSSEDDAVDACVTKKEYSRTDTFSVYVNRAKMKIRKTSSIGGKKITSFKGE